jgi:hypothetical protein
MCIKSTSQINENWWMAEGELPLIAIRQKDKKDNLCFLTQWMKSGQKSLKFWRTLFKKLAEHGSDITFNDIKILLLI